jgi:hypothetical protein
MKKGQYQGLARRSGRNLAVKSRDTMLRVRHAEIVCGVQPFTLDMVDLAGTGVWLRSRETRFAILTAAMVVTILFACLYPFRFSIRYGSIDAVGALVGSWAKPPRPTDFILNIALYAPLGVFGALSFSARSRRPWWRVAIVTTGGALLSIAIELTQYFDTARYTAASDVYANVLGTVLGASGIVLLFRR